MFSELTVWDDREPRLGEENMAVDQALLELNYHLPILRIYQWSRPTVSFGYFHPLHDVSTTFAANKGDDLFFVRRWTGGGVVDHRIDVTYTLAIPRAEELAQKRGSESYRVIHQALAIALQEMGENAILEQYTGGDGGIECFTNPVPYDLCDPDGKKIAGAGQRRSRYGLLHQGSIVPTLDREKVSSQLPSYLSQKLAECSVPFEPNEELFQKVSELSASRYASQAWLKKK